MTDVFFLAQACVRERKSPSAAAVYCKSTATKKKKVPPPEETFEEEMRRKMEEGMHGARLLRERIPHEMYARILYTAHKIKKRYLYEFTSEHMYKA